MVTIDFEAHFYTQVEFDYLATRKQMPKFMPIEGHQGGYNLWFTDGIPLYQNDEFIKILCDLDASRIAAMDISQMLPTRS